MGFCSHDNDVELSDGIFDRWHFRWRHDKGGKIEISALKEPLFDTYILLALMDELEDEASDLTNGLLATMLSEMAWAFKASGCQYALDEVPTLQEPFELHHGSEKREERAISRGEEQSRKE